MKRLNHDGFQIDRKAISDVSAIVISEKTAKKLTRVLERKLTLKILHLLDNDDFSVRKAGNIGC